ncbi:MAG: hypothetical protein ACREXJ_14705 [Gammaproteobacteria bacterium]
MSNLTVNRRQILKFLGAGAALFMLEPPRAAALLSPRGAKLALPLTPVRLPHPLPIYERMRASSRPRWGQARAYRPRRVPGSTPIPSSMMWWYRPSTNAM